MLVYGILILQQQNNPFTWQSKPQALGIPSPTDFAGTCIYQSACLMLYKCLNVQKKYLPHLLI